MDVAGGLAVAVELPFQAIAAKCFKVVRGRVDVAVSETGQNQVLSGGELSLASTIDNVWRQQVKGTLFARGKLFSTSVRLMIMDECG